MTTVLFLAALSLSPPGFAGPDDDNDDHEVPVAIADLPAEVSKAIEKRWPGAKLLSAERDGKWFDVDFQTTDGKTLEAEVDPDGKIGKVEDETHDDEDDT